MSENLHDTFAGLDPALRKVGKAFLDLSSQVAAGEMSMEQGLGLLAAVSATDAEGASWSLTAGGSWLRAVPGHEPAPADPTIFVPRNPYASAETAPAERPSFSNCRTTTPATSGSFDPFAQHALTADTTSTSTETRWSTPPATGPGVQSPATDVRPVSPRESASPGGLRDSAASLVKGIRPGPAAASLPLRKIATATASLVMVILAGTQVAALSQPTDPAQTVPAGEQSQLSDPNLVPAQTEEPSPADTPQQSSPTGQRTQN